MATTGGVVTGAVHDERVRRLLCSALCPATGARRVVCCVYGARRVALWNGEWWTRLVKW
jgi:hypothetical protein